jgi:DNA-binding NarL/FixJ family response regulator
VLIREGVARVIGDAGFDVVGQAGDADQLLRLVRDDPPDVAVVDVKMPPTHTVEGLVAAETIRSELPQVGVLVLSQYVETHYAVRLVEPGSGSVGYLLKDRVSDLDAFADAIRRVAAGGLVIDPEVAARLVRRARVDNPLDRLSEREREVLSLMAEGRSNRAIGQALSLNAKTVEAHITSIFTKLDLAPAPDDHRRVLAVLAFLRN